MGRWFVEVAFADPGSIAGQELKRWQRKRKVTQLHLICRIGKAYQCVDNILVSALKTLEGYDYQWSSIDQFPKGYVFTVLVHDRNTTKEDQSIWVKILDEDGTVKLITAVTSSANFRKIT